MTLIVVDSSRKVSTLRPLFAGTKVVNADFPLYLRFRKGKAKLEGWPALRPVAAEVKQLQKHAVGQDVLGIFDDTMYGRVQARDLREAMSDLNNNVAFKFVAAYTREAIEAAAEVSDIPDDCDLKYVLNRFISSRIDSELERYCGDEGDVSCTWQQALLLGAIKRGTRGAQLVDRYVDNTGRVYIGQYDPDAESVLKTYGATFKPVRKSVLDLATPDIDFDSVYPALEKLRGSGYIAVTEGEITSPIFDDVIDAVTEHADSLQLDGVGILGSQGFFVTSFERESTRMPEADFVKKVYDVIKRDTLLGCCGPVRSNMIVATVHGLETAYVQTERPTWLPLSDIPVGTTVEDPDPDSVKRVLHVTGASDKDLVAAARESRFTSRDLWSAALYLLRKKLAIRLDKTWYLTSRGCLVVHVLDTVFPDSLCGAVADKIDALIEQHERATNNTPDLQRTETLGALKVYMDDNVKQVNPDELWTNFAGDAEVHVSANAAWLISTGTAQGVFYNGSTDEFEAVPTGQAVENPCPCGAAHIVNTNLSATYETIVECSACGLSRPLTGIAERES